MAELTIRTNHHWREMSHGYEIDAPFDGRLTPVEPCIENNGEITEYDGAWYNRESFKAAYPLRYEFDYLSAEEFDDREFFRYRGVWYCTDQFMQFGYPFGGHPEDSPFKDWDGYHGDSFFSGVVLKWGEDYEYFKVGTFYS